MVSGSQDTTLAFPDQYLPTECGEDNIRCEDLSSSVIREEGVSQLRYAILVPSTRALLIVVLQYDNISSSFAIFDNYTLEVRAHCSPIKFFDINGHVYTPCLNLEDGFLTIFELYLNTSFIQRSNFSQPLIENLNPTSLSPISKPVYADLGDAFHGRRHQILFQTGNYIIGFDPTVFNLVTTVNISNYCPAITEMRYAGSQMLLVYCNDSALYIDLVHQEVHEKLPYDDNGHPYLCPRNNVKFLYFSNIACLSYRRNQASEDCIDIPSISTGRCFGANSSIFVYSDANTGAVNTVVIAEDGNATRTTLSPRSYGVTRVFNDRYVVFSGGEENITTVVDSQANFRTVIEARNLQPDLMTIVPVLQPLTPHSTSTSIPTPEPTSTMMVPPTSSPDVSHKKKIALPVAMGVLGAVALILIFIATPIVYKRIKAKR